MERSPAQSSHLMNMTTSNVQRLGTGDSGSPSYDANKSSSPSASTVTTASVSMFPSIDFPLSTITSSPDWSQLSSDMQLHLRWFGDNVTNYHYCITNDCDDFFKTILPNLALRSESLLNALVGFSAYHSTFQNPAGRLQNFLQYYNKSVTLLLQALRKKEKHTIGTLLTILQLATIEVHTQTLVLLWMPWLSIISGIFRGLGQLDGPPESSSRNHHENVHASVSHANTGGPHVSHLVRSI